MAKSRKVGPRSKVQAHTTNAGVQMLFRRMGANLSRDCPLLSFEEAGKMRIAVAWRCTHKTKDIITGDFCPSSPVLVSSPLVFGLHVNPAGAAAAVNRIWSTATNSSFSSEGQLVILVINVTDSRSQRQQRDLRRHANTNREAKRPQTAIYVECRFWDTNSPNAKLGVLTFS